MGIILKHTSTQTMSRTLLITLLSCLLSAVCGFQSVAPLQSKRAGVSSMYMKAGAEAKTGPKIGFVNPFAKTDSAPVGKVVKVPKSVKAKAKAAPAPKTSGFTNPFAKKAEPVVAKKAATKKPAAKKAAQAKKAVPESKFGPQFRF